MPEAIQRLAERGLFPGAGVLPGQVQGQALVGVGGAGGALGAALNPIAIVLVPDDVSGRFQRIDVAVQVAQLPRVSLVVFVHQGHVAGRLAIQP
jgi:uncharacterized spore protein YtfJ